MKQVILAIDPGTINAGYAIAVKNAPHSKIVDFGALTMKSTQKIAERIEIFCDFFDIKIKRYGVTHIALETPFLGKNPQTFLKLGYLRGVLYLLAQKQGAEVIEYAPRQIKSAVTGSGGASKEQVAKVLYTMFPQLNQVKKTIQNDTTDALAICLCAL